MRAGKKEKSTCWKNRDVERRREWGEREREGESLIMYSMWERNIEMPRYVECRLIMCTM